MFIHDLFQRVHLLSLFGASTQRWLLCIFRQEAQRRQGNRQFPVRRHGDAGMSRRASLLAVAAAGLIVEQSLFLADSGVGSTRLDPYRPNTRQRRSKQSPSDRLMERARNARKTGAPV